MLAGIESNDESLPTICAVKVRMKVILGVIFGRTAKEVSPTRPRVTLLTASVSIGSLK
jgi:hypothetical protein